MAAFQIRAGEHLVRDTEAARFLRTHLNDPALITIFNTRTKSWLIAYWLHRDTGIAYDVEDLGPEPILTRDMVQFMERTKVGCTMQTIKGRLLQQHRNHMAQEEAESMQYAEAWSWAKKRTRDKAPAPWAFDGGFAQQAPAMAVGA